MRLLLSTTLVLVITIATYATERGYSGYALYRCLPKTDEQVDTLNELHSGEYDGEIEFWRQPSARNRSVDIMVSPEFEDRLRTRLRVTRVPFKRIMHDIGEVIRRTSKPRHGVHRNGMNLDPIVFYANFQPFSLIEAKLKALAAADSRVKLEEVGRSTEKRPLYLVKVSGQSEANKPIVFLDAGHHAREWATHSSILYVLETLLNNKLPTKPIGAQSISLAAMLEKYDFWIMPVVNPDGYEYSHKKDRLWRKNRDLIQKTGSTCEGVDLNRNYPFMWELSEKCDVVYSGPKALSEPETQAVANVLLKSDRKFSMYISLHSYAGMILTPYGYKNVSPDNIDDLKRVGDAGIEAIRALRGTHYVCGPAAELLYEAPGGSDDFAYATAGIKLAYTIEIASQEGFAMLKEEIVPTAQEIALGLAAMVNAIG